MLHLGFFVLMVPLAKRPPGGEEGTCPGEYQSSWLNIRTKVRRLNTQSEEYMEVK